MTRKPPAIATVLASFALACTLVPVALANKGGGGSGKQSAVAPLALVSAYVWNSPNPAAPTWCLNEDDYHQRTWSGSLRGGFTATEQLCGTSADYSGGIWWDAGGIGLQADAYVVGTPNDIAIASPQGAAHHAVLVGTSTSRGVTTYHYQSCYVPPFSVTYNVGGTPLPGGTWQITISGNVTVKYFVVTAEMADVTFQRQSCPPSEQNLIP